MGDKGNSLEGSRRRMNGFSQREYIEENHANRLFRVMGDDRDGCVSNSCGDDVSQWRGNSHDSRVGCDGRDGRQQGSMTQYHGSDKRRIHSRSLSRHSQRSTSQTRNKRRRFRDCSSNPNTSCRNLSRSQCNNRYNIDNDGSDSEALL